VSQAIGPALNVVTSSSPSKTRSSAWIGRQNPLGVSGKLVILWRFFGGLMMILW